MDRLMTKKTYEILETQKKVSEQKVAEMGGESEGGHARAGFHDNAGFEHERNRTLAEVMRVGNLSEAVIIEPRLDTSSIDIGNKVKARFIEEEAEETLYLLGQDDVIRRSDLSGTIVSAESPLGKSIRGKTVGDTVEIKNSATNKFHVKILDIEPGDF